MSTTNVTARRDRSFTPPRSFVPSTYLGLALQTERGNILSPAVRALVTLALVPARWLRALVVRRSIERQLSALSDHLLADIGISRGNIPHVARSASRMEVAPLRSKGAPMWVARAEFNARVRSLSAVNDPEFRRAA